jgi:AcrR family transcriptional regulator
MSGTSRSKEQRRRLSGTERRRSILDAAMRVFAERGYERASMREIARSAGITTPVIYDHFSSKRELQIALIEEQEASLRNHQGRERELEPGPDLARALIDDFFSWVESHPYAWRMLFHDTPSDPQVLAAQRGAKQRSVAQIVSFVSPAPELRVTTGLGREVVERLLAESIYAVVNALAAWWWEHREVPREQLVNLAYDLLWTGLATISGLNDEPHSADMKSPRPRGQVRLREEG